MAVLFSLSFPVFADMRAYRYLDSAMNGGSGKISKTQRFVVEPGAGALLGGTGGFIYGIADLVRVSRTSSSRLPTGLIVLGLPFFHGFLGVGSGLTASVMQGSLRDRLGPKKSFAVSVFAPAFVAGLAGVIWEYTDPFYKQHAFLRNPARVFVSLAVPVAIGAIGGAVLTETIRGTSH